MSDGEASGDEPVKPARTDRAWLLAAVLLVGVFHLPSLDTGYVSDDATLSLTPGVAQIRDVGVLEIIVEDIEWFLTQGRLLALSLTVMLNFTLFPTLLSYKLSKLVAMMALLGLWGAFVHRLTGCRATALLGVLCCGLLFQYRLYHDAVLSFGWHLPQAMAFFIGGLYLQLEANRRDERRWSVASALLFTCSFLSYEVMLPLVLLHVALAPWKRSFRAALASVGPHLAAAVALLALMLGVRLYFSPAPSLGTEIRLDPLAMALVVVRQIYAALPLSYGATFGTLLDRRVSSLGAGAMLLAPAVMLIAHRARSVLQAKPPFSLRPLVVAALLLWVLPGLMIAPSAKYQREVVWGLGYLPDFISVFGVSALLAVGLVTGLRRLRRRSAQYALLALLVPLALLGYQHNTAVAEVLATQWEHPRSLLRDALQRGLLDSDPARSGVWVRSGSPNCPWQAPAFFAMHAGFIPEAVWSADPPPERLAPPPNSTSGEPAAPRPLGEPLSYVHYGAASALSGLAVAGTAESVTSDAPHQPLGPRARIFLRKPFTPGHAANFTYFAPLPHGARLHFDEVDASGRRIHREMWIEDEIHGPGLGLSGSGDDWQLWTIESTPGFLLALESFRVSTLPN